MILKKNKLPVLIRVFIILIFVAIIPVKIPAQTNKTKQKKNQKDEVLRLKREEYIPMNAFLSIKTLINKGYDDYYLMEYQDALKHFSNALTAVTNITDKLEIICNRTGMKYNDKEEKYRKIKNLFIRSHTYLEKGLNSYITQMYGKSLSYMLETERTIETAATITRILLDRIRDMPLVDLHGLRKEIVRYKNSQLRDLYKKNEIYNIEKEYEKKVKSYKNRKELIELSMSYIRFLLQNYSELAETMADKQKSFTSQTSRELKDYHRDIYEKTSLIKGTLKDFSEAMLPFEKTLLYKNATNEGTNHSLEKP